jgi:hypothetical protein
MFLGQYRMFTLTLVETFRRVPNPFGRCGLLNNLSLEASRCNPLDESLLNSDETGLYYDWFNFNLYH